MIDQVATDLWVMHTQEDDGSSSIAGPTVVREWVIQHGRFVPTGRERIFGQQVAAVARMRLGRSFLARVDIDSPDIVGVWI